MDRANEAFAIMAAGRLNCAQTVLSAFASELGLERDLSIRLALGFGSGMGRGGHTCGAATGAYMVLGLAQKIDPANRRESLEKTYRLIREFNRQFAARHGTVVCRELIGLDLNCPEGLAAAREQKVFVTLCPDFVKSAVEMLERLLTQGKTPG